MTEFNGNLTLDELYASANEMCRKWWGTEYTGTISLVKRNWKRQFAAFRYWDRGARTTIEMSTKVNESLPREEVLGNLLHELVHWRLFTTTLERDGFDRAWTVAGDDSPEFVRECIRVGAPFSGTKKAQQAAKLYGGVAQ